MSRTSEVDHLADVVATIENVSRCLTSPNCEDSNGEEANVVDGLYEIAKAIRFASKNYARGGCERAGHEYKFGPLCAWCGKRDAI
jgi:hypothetical protein